MYQINNEKFGHFLAEVRKEKQMTQKDLADKLFVSDKNSCGIASAAVVCLKPYLCTVN